jgi:hypothetical protein
MDSADGTAAADMTATAADDTTAEDDAVAMQCIETYVQEGQERLHRMLLFVQRKPWQKGRERTDACSIDGALSNGIHRCARGYPVHA